MEAREASRSAKMWGSEARACNGLRRAGSGTALLSGATIAASEIKQWPDGGKDRTRIALTAPQTKPHNAVTTLTWLRSWLGAVPAWPAPTRPGA